MVYRFRVQLKTKWSLCLHRHKWKSKLQFPSKIRNNKIRPVVNKENFQCLLGNADCNFRAAREILRIRVMTENRLGAGGMGGGK